jgi:molybdopterin-guanine dinucleotide biosynthesis protein B
LKAIGIVGFKRSGKTTLGVRLARELAGKGHRIAVLKHASSDIALPETDTSKYRPYAPFVAAIAPGATEVVLAGPRRLEDVLVYCDADLVLVEGFKQEKTFPKIVCLRDAADRARLFDGLELFTAGLRPDAADVHILNDDDIKRIAPVVMERAFKLPALDCGLCGHESCHALAKRIVKGEASWEQCLERLPTLQITCAGERLPLDAHAALTLRTRITAVLSSLKGLRRGTIEIEIPG